MLHDKLGKKTDYVTRYRSYDFTICSHFSVFKKVFYSLWYLLPRQWSLPGLPPAAIHDVCDCTCIHFVLKSKSFLLCKKQHLNVLIKGGHSLTKRIWCHTQKHRALCTKIGSTKTYGDSTWNLFTTLILRLELFCLTILSKFRPVSSHLYLLLM